jgi:hypothetical protein
MSAMSVRPGTGTATGLPSGASASTLLIPIGLAVIFGVLGLVYALMAAPTDEDRAAAAYLASRLEQNTPTPPSTPTTATGSSAAPAPAQPAYEPLQRANGQRMPSTSAAWTFRDRTNHQ